MEKEIGLEYGSGGENYRELVREVFLPAYGSEELRALGDSAVCAPGSGAPLAFTTDGFVVKPMAFPGGDVGSLAVSGTVNDLAVAGAVPRWLSVAMILEAGLPTAVLREACASIARTAARAGVRVVTGDTKVVGRGQGDGIYITTSGVGTFDGGWAIPPQRAAAGDALIVSGPLASHGMAVMCAREGLEFDPPPQSDARPLNALIAAVLGAGIPVHAMRDPTRGGLAATLCEWAEEGGCDLVYEEARLPVLPNVRAACALLGIDPVFVANEGVCVFAVPPEAAAETLRILRGHPDGALAAVVGAARPGQGHVLADTGCGTLRRVLLPMGELLPRIC